MIKQQIIMIKKKQENFVNWDFKNVDTKQLTHGLHTYPAMMIPQIARRLIYLYGQNAETLLDPFMGSGTSLVEASTVNHIKEAHGFDLNPLAVLISRVKTTTIDPFTLESQKKKIMSSDMKGEVPKFKNLDFWFKPKVTERLADIKAAIEEIKNNQVKDFFLVCFSETVRLVSNTRNNEFKLYRMEQSKLENYNPDVKKIFSKVVEKNILGMKSYIENRAKTKVSSECFNSMDNLPLEDESIDLIVTSPPYGDSRTTVAYGQFSRLASEWLEYKEASSLDNKLLGGKPVNKLDSVVKSPTLKQIIEKIAVKDEKRAREVLSFYADFEKVVSQLDRVVAKRGHVCFVVGNRTVKGVNIPTDKIMSEMFLSSGKYEYITTHMRNIPNKRMPSLNSPSNKTGEKLTTMCNEFIFVLQKK